MVLLDIRVACVALLLRQATAYVAAVVQHTIVTASSPSQTIAANLALYSTAAAGAKAAGAEIVNFPEFGLGMPTNNCSSPGETAGWTYCEAITAPIGAVLCGNASAAHTPVQVNASCMAQANNMWVGVNTCERSALGAYNTELVFAPNGSLAAVYRKDHPWFTKCFLKPTPSLVTVDARATLGVTLGLMVRGVACGQCPLQLEELRRPSPRPPQTCYDILFPEPGPELVKEGVRHIVYSAAIPVVGVSAGAGGTPACLPACPPLPCLPPRCGAVRWHGSVDSRIQGRSSRLGPPGASGDAGPGKGLAAAAPAYSRRSSPRVAQEGESGVFVNGTRLSPVPPRTSGTSFVLATVPPF